LPRLLFVGGALIGAALVLAGCGGSRTTVNAPGANTNGLSVTGTGRASGPPDIVILQIGVQADAVNVAAAREQAAVAAQAVTDSVKKNGVDDKDVRTSQFSIQPQYDTSRTGASVIRSYRVSNVLTVKVRKIDNAGKVIDDAASAGGNNTVVQSIAFSIDNPTKLQDTAREDAMKQAQARASQLAKLGNVSLGKPISISESGGVQPFFANASALAAPRTADTSTPIESGQLDITVTVNVLYAIE
jgi:uncharacterized protein YggE